MTDTEKAISALYATVRRLLGPNGCPWDRSQTVASLAPYAVEEACELLDAVHGGDHGGIREELGDLLMLVLLTGEIGSREGKFTLSEVVSDVTTKLIRRHPHVFGELTVTSSEEVKQNWEEIKRGEGKKTAADGLPVLPASLPALSQAFRLSKAAAKRGFDWPDKGGPLAKVSEEWGELREAVARDRRQGVEQELGDLLLAVANLGRVCGVNPEAALRSACARFRRRFERIAKQEGPEAFGDLARMQAIWDEAKGKEHHERRKPS